MDAMRPIGILIALVGFVVSVYGVATSQIWWFLIGLLVAIPGTVLWALGAAVHTRRHGEWSPLVISRRQSGAATA
jgi:hypothetical protein